MLEQLSDEELKALQQEQRHVLDIIRSQDIVTVTRAGRPLPVQRQANPEFTTLEGLLKRSQLTLNDELHKVFSLLWALPDLEKTKDGSQLTKAGYFKIMRALHSALQPKRSRRAQLDKTIAKDYEDDLAKFGELNKQGFCRSLFELVDMWCNSLEPEQYAAFAWALVVNVVDPTTGTLRKGKIRCVFDTADAALLALWREDNRNRRVDSLRADILLRIPEVVARLQSRKKARVLSGADVRQLKAMSKKMGLEFGAGDAEQRERTRYTFLHNPGTPQTKAMTTTTTTTTTTTANAGSETLSESSAPSSPDPWPDPEARSQLDATANNESEALSLHTSVSSVPRSIQQQFCPAIIITHSRRTPMAKAGREVEILQCEEHPPSRPAAPAATAPSTVRPASTKKRAQHRGGREGDTNLYILQRLHSASKRPAPQMPRAVTAPAGALRLGPTRVLLEDAAENSGRKPAASSSIQPRAQLSPSRNRFHAQSWHSLIEPEEGKQQSADSELAGQPASEPVLTRSWTWLKLPPGAHRPTPTVDDDGDDDGDDNGNGDDDTQKEAFAAGARLRSQSAPALCQPSTCELVGRTLLSTECKDIPRRAPRTAALRRKRKERSVDPAVASPAERLALQQLALEQWYHSKDFRRLY